MTSSSLLMYTRPDFSKLNSRILSQPTPVVVGLDGSGATTVITSTSELPDPGTAEVTHVLAITGR